MEHVRTFAKTYQVIARLWAYVMGHDVTRWTRLANYTYCRAIYPLVLTVTDLLHALIRPKGSIIPLGRPQNCNLLAFSARQEPYVKPASPTLAGGNDKENIAPASTSNSLSKPKHTKAGADPAIDWRDIELETRLGEVPCYDDASNRRRKLNSLPHKKSGIPCQDRST